MLWDGGTSIVIDKPAGIPTQAPAGMDSVELRIRKQFENRTTYVACVHRLDRPVGGVLLVALQKRAARLLGTQFETRKIKKEYVAVVKGRVQNPNGRWIDHLAKLEDTAKATITSEGSSNAKLATTDTELIRYDPTMDASWLRLYPVTGRMHQLRVQAAHRGHPILGDSLYGNADNWTSQQNLFLETLRRQIEQEVNPTPDPIQNMNQTKEPVKTQVIALRADNLEFFDPKNAQRISVESTCQLF